MIQHEFIFHPGKWIGEGRVLFSGSAEILRFYTRWEIGPDNPSGIACTQVVEMQGIEPNMRNAFLITPINPTSFEIALENELLGLVKGKGVINDTTLAWEFHAPGKLEGFEVYEIQDNGDYMLHAEYTSTDQFRTTIDGRIWKKSD